MGTKLNNGNFLVSVDNGYYVFEPTLNLYIYEKRNIFSDFDIRYCNLVQFSEEDGGYILFRFKNSQYILSPDGNLLLSNYDISLVNNYWNDYSYTYYSIVPYNHINDTYYYYMIYFNDYNQLYFKKYSFHSKNNSIIEEYYYLNNNLDDNYQYFVTCK